MYEFDSRYPLQCFDICMGSNTKSFNRDEYYAAKSTVELQGLLKSTQDFIDKHAQFRNGMANEHAHFLKQLIASRIGTKKN